MLLRPVRYIYREKTVYKEGILKFPCQYLTALYFWQLHASKQQ